MSKRKRTKVISAERFELVDSKGRLRALLYASAWDGDPRCELLDKDGIGRLSLEVADGQPLIKFMNVQGQPLIYLTVSEGDVSIIALSATDGSPKVTLEVDNEGEPSISIFDENGRSR